MKRATANIDTEILFLLCAVACLRVSVVRSQSCSATTVFGTDSQEIVSRPDYADQGLFFNTNATAPCTGILTMWHYCYYTEPPENMLANGRIRFGIARPLQSGNVSILEDSFTDATIDIDPSSVSSLVCGNYAPSTSDFQVEAGDVLLACVNESSRIRVVSSGVSGSITGRSTVPCDNGITTAVSSPSFFPPSSVLHVYAEINECGVNGDGVSCNDETDEPTEEHTNEPTMHTAEPTMSNTDVTTVFGETTERVTENTDAPTVLSCPEGYQIHVEPDGHQDCEDIDECKSAEHHNCTSACTNTEGSYVCGCASGYELSDSGDSCQDVDECTVSNGGCDHTCDNDEGSFECHCNDGFMLEEDGFTCTEQSSYTQIISSTVFVVLLAIIAIITGGLVVMVVMYKRQKKHMSQNNATNEHELQPPLKLEFGNRMENPVYAQVQDYEDPSDEPPLYAFVSSNVYNSIASDEDARSNEVELYYATPDYETVLSEMKRNRLQTNPDESMYTQPPSEERDIYLQLKEQGIRGIPVDHIILTERLGSGQFGTVHKGVWSHSKGTIEVAIKTLKDDATQTDRVKFLQEAAIMGQFRHPSVIQLYGVAARGNTLMLVIEIASKGDLKHLLHTLRPDPGEFILDGTIQRLLEYSQQTALGMDYLSGKGFVHRDLAARNILVSSHNVCKVADFGMSRDLADEDYYVSRGGKIPVRWTAPEAILYKKYSTSSDVWSYGCLLYEIWSLGHKPFESIENFKIASIIASGYRPAPPPGCPKKVYQLMINCWHQEAVGRPSFREVVLALLEHEDSLLHIPPEALSSHSQAGMLGAPLEAGMLMYTDVHERFC